jgi:uncharacterized membrane protein YhaH (DUF805 family)
MSGVVRVLRLIWSAHGGISRAQWWLGHLAALALMGAGLVLAGLLVIPLVVFAGLDPRSPSIALVFAGLAGAAALQFVWASYALCKKRLAARGHGTAVLDAAMGLALIEMALRGAAFLAGSAHAPMPFAPPDWLVAVSSLATLAALALVVIECGVLERREGEGKALNAGPRARAGSGTGRA